MTSTTFCGPTPRNFHTLQNELSSWFQSDDLNWLMECTITLWTVEVLHVVHISIRSEEKMSPQSLVLHNCIS